MKSGGNRRDISLHCLDDCSSLNVRQSGQVGIKQDSVPVHQKNRPLDRYERGDRGDFEGRGMRPGGARCGTGPHLVDLRSRDDQRRRSRNGRRAGIMKKLRRRILLSECVGIQRVPRGNRDVLAPVDGVAHGRSLNDASHRRLPQKLTGAGVERVEESFASTREE